jgi:hypothetical protein
MAGPLSHLDEVLVDVLEAGVCLGANEPAEKAGEPHDINLWLMETIPPEKVSLSTPRHALHRRQSTAHRPGEWFNMGTQAYWKSGAVDRSRTALQGAHPDGGVHWSGAAVLAQHPTQVLPSPGKEQGRKIESTQINRS